MLAASSVCQDVLADIAQGAAMQSRGRKDNPLSAVEDAAVTILRRVGDQPQR